VKQSESYPFVHVVSGSDNWASFQYPGTPKITVTAGTVNDLRHDQETGTIELVIGDTVVLVESA
jgi:hypothetical protein